MKKAQNHAPLPPSFIPTIQLAASYLRTLPPLSLAVKYHGNDESIDEHPINNPADESDDDGDGSVYDDGDDANAGGDDANTDRR